MSWATISRNASIWLPGWTRHYIHSVAAEPAIRVWVTFADHFEPCWKGADPKTAKGRVALWSKKWPEIAERHRDSSGRKPRYTFFFPEEQYHPNLIGPLAEMSSAGIADVEVHLHHDGEGEDNFVDRIRRFTETLHLRHGLLRELNGRIAFGFIHGNWALDNSGPDGRWCGLNNEITLLKDLGCYADFTLPSAPWPTQTRMVNTIYWATDDPDRPKSHDSGQPLLPGAKTTGDLLMIPGPLGFNFRGKGRFLPRLEIGELAAHDPPVMGRARSWFRFAPRIGGDVFLKLFTHGAQEQNAANLLNGQLNLCLQDLEEECSRSRSELCFATAYELWAAVQRVSGYCGNQSVIGLKPSFAGEREPVE